MGWKKWPCLALIAAPALAPAPAQAGFYSGDDLYDVCTTARGSDSYIEKAYECVGYITGAVDAFNTTREVNRLDSCIPAKVTISQLCDVTVDYLRKNPVDRQKSASSQVFAATRKAWPCPKTSPKASATKTKKRK